jgi:hypothetical protein
MLSSFILSCLLADNTASTGSSSPLDPNFPLLVS